MGLKAERQVQDQEVVEVQANYAKVSLTLQLVLGILAQVWQRVNEDPMQGIAAGSLVPH